MRVVIMRSNPVLPDPRVEKEANTLLGLGYSIKILAWNRLAQKNAKKYGELHVKNGLLPIRWFNINASFGNGLKTLLPLIFFQLCLTGWLIKHRREYDVIHACDFDTVIPAWLCSKLFNKKYVYDIFDYYVDAFYVPKILKTMIEKIDIFMINAANAVIIVNESRKKQIKKSRPRKLFIIHNSPDISNDINDDKPEVEFEYSKKTKFAYIGILGEGRLLKEILEVFPKYPEWELHIGGFGFYEDLVKKAADKCENIFYYGRVPYKRALELEQECDILFAVYDPDIPNHRYSSPNKLYEAMILGKPIIVGKGTGIDDIVETVNIGKAIEYSAESFEQAAIELIAEQDMWIDIKQRMQSHYNEHYSWEIMSIRLEEIYTTI